MKVLVVDDDQDQLEVRCLLFSQQGYEAIPAATEAAALQVATEEEPCCAVMDLRLPTPEAGLRLIRALKQAHPQLTILALTGADPKEFVQRPEAKLVQQIFAKGESTKALLEVLRRTAAHGVG